MISDRQLKLTIIGCLIVLTLSLGYAWYVINKQDLPTTFGLCLIGVMASLYFIGLTFDRYRRALYQEAMRLYQEEQATSADLRSRLHVRDITINKCRESIEAANGREANWRNTEFELRTRVQAIISNLNTAIESVSPTKEVDRE